MRTIDGGDSSSSTFSGFGAITVFSEGTQISTTANTLRFRGEDVIAVQGESPNIVDIFVPPTYFDPTMSVVVSDGGVFNGQSAVEKGYVPQKVTVSFVTNDPAYPITAFSNLTLNGASISLDLGYTVTGGAYTASLPDPSAFSVSLESGVSTSIETASIRYDRRLWHFKSNLESGMTESVIENGAGYLAATRQGDRAFSPSATPEYLWVVVPVAYGNVTGFTNPANNLVVPFKAPEVVTVTNAFGFVGSYNCYCSVNPTAGSVTVRVA